ncbi:MAG: hypothetical protein ACRDGO_05030 [Actinomycetota bacterium]
MTIQRARALRGYSSPLRTLRDDMNATLVPTMTKTTHASMSQ